MSLYATPEIHAANPPETWRIERVQTAGMYRPRWALIIDGSTEVRDYHEKFATRRAAEEERESGWTRRMWEKECRWYAGEPVDNWRPWADIKAEREARERKKVAA